MATKKLGIASIEVNKKFDSEEEAYNHARCLLDKIKRVCIKNSDKGYVAQAMITVSNIKKDVSQLNYVSSGKVGRPKKELQINDLVANGWYNGDYKTDWHLHILLVSKPSYTFRDIIKQYIDKNWIDVPSLNESVPFDIKKLGKVYKKNCNIRLADYFIKQSSKVLFCNVGKTEKLKYTLRDYYYSYLKMDSDRKKLYARHIKKPMSEVKFLERLEKIEAKFKDIENYFWSISKRLEEEQRFSREEKEKKELEIYNKFQRNDRRKLLDSSYI